MDHLQTGQERKDRWYARHIIPEYVTVQSLTFDDIQQANRKTSIAADENHNDNDDDDDDKLHVTQNSSRRNNPYPMHEDVYGIPSSFLSSSPKHEIETRRYLKSHLQTHGFAIIQNVLNETECNHALSLAWDYLECASLAERKFQENSHHSTPERAVPTAFHTLEQQEVDVSQVQTDNRNERSIQSASKNQSVANTLDTPVKRKERESYTSKYFPRSVEGRIFPFYGSGHSSFMWYLRSHPAVRNAFAAVHNIQHLSSSSSLSQNRELMTSLDGFVLWTDMDAKGSGSKSGNGEKNGSDLDLDLDQGWFHIDQSPEKKPGFASYQALVNLLPVTPETGGNVLVVGSHRFFPHHYLQKTNHSNGDDKTNDDDDGDGGDKKIVHNGALFYQERLKELDGDDWLEIDPRDDKILKSNRVISCLLNPGDILIWDSRTVHCSHREILYGCREEKEGNRNRPMTEIMESQHGLIRAAGLVNMIPRGQVSGQVCKQRLDAVKGSRTLTHWVEKVAPLGEEREEEVQKEACCVGYMKESVTSKERKVLLSYEDLNDFDRNLL